MIQQSLLRKEKYKKKDDLNKKLAYQFNAQPK